MATTSRAGLEGAAKLELDLRRLGKALSVPIMRAAVRAGVQPAMALMRQRIPVGRVAHKTYKKRFVQPGFAKANIRVVTKSEQGGTVVSAAVGERKEGFYAVQFVERGTRKMRAQAWLQPSFAQAQDQMQAALADKLRDRIENQAKATGSG